MAPYASQPWGRLSPRAHLLSGLPIIVAGVASAFFVVCANAWMNTPTGVTIKHGKLCHVDAWWPRNPRGRAGGSEIVRRGRLGLGTHADGHAQSDATGGAWVPLHCTGCVHCDPPGAQAADYPRGEAASRREPCRRDLDAFPSIWTLDPPRDTDWQLPSTSFIGTDPGGQPDIAALSS